MRDSATGGTTLDASPFARLYRRGEDLRSGSVVRGTVVPEDANPIHDLVVSPTGQSAWIRADATTRRILRFDADPGEQARAAQLIG